MSDVDRYRTQTRGLDGPIHYDVTDLPDEAVETLFAYNAWLLGERVRQLGRDVLELVEPVLEPIARTLNRWLRR